MPLSDHEQRVLDEIEKNLYQEDPSFAHKANVGHSSGIADGRKRAKLGAVCFVAGFLALFAFFYSSILLVGVVAFAAMVLGIVLLAGALRSLGSPSAFVRGPADRVGRAVSGWEQRVKDRYKKD